MADGEEKRFCFVCERWTRPDYLFAAICMLMGFVVGYFTHR